MQLKLKKSLYLGLAALTFASVAGASSASITTANAASKHHAAKVTKKHHKKVTKKKVAKKYTKKAPVTFKVTKSLNQGVVYKATGSNAIYTKPNGVKGSQIKVTKDNMASKANSNSADDLFMAYQQVKTSKGVHYYKVVSFDKKVRGYVYTKGIAQVDPTSPATVPANTTGYVTSNNISNYPYGSKFGSKVQNFNGIDFSKDKFTVTGAMSVGNDTYYKVTDQSNALINGWVNANDFTNNTPKSVTDAQNYAKAIHVSYVNTNNYGSVLSTKDLTPTMSSDGTYSTSNVVKAINDSLIGSGYNSIDGSKVNNTSQGSINLGQPSNIVRQGDSLTVLVTPQGNGEKTSLNYSLSGISNKGSFDQKIDPITTSGLSAVNVSKDLQSALFNGYKNGSFNYNNFKSQLLSSGAPMNKLTSSNGKYTYVFDAAMTESHAANPALFDNNNQIINNATFSAINAQNGNKGLNIVYDAIDNTTGKTVNNNSVNLFQ